MLGVFFAVVQDLGILAGYISVATIPAGILGSGFKFLIAYDLYISLEGGSI